MTLGTNLKLLAVAAIAGVATSLAAASWTSKLVPAASPISGDYVESRTASVFCGECHFNSQMVSYGHDALMAWSFDGGSYRGTSLKGVRVMAAVTCEENLKFHELPHFTQLVVDSSATAQQVTAVTALLREKCDELGTIKLVTRAPVTFSHDSTGYKVQSPAFAELEVSYRTDDACCTMPGTVWYTPLSPTAGRKVGFTEFAGFTGELTAPWSQSGDDYAMYGKIAF